MGKSGIIVIPVLMMLTVATGCSPGKPGPEGGSPTGPGGVKLGMSREEVIQVMLDEVQLLQMSGQVTNPYATRFLERSEGGTLEVMYYYIGMKRGDDRITEEELLPVILADNAVIGWGWETLEEMVGGRPSPGM